MKPVSKTAWYCCGVRAQDAQSEHPLIGDPYAKTLLGEEGMRYWDEFRHLQRPNASNIVRHYIIDNDVKQLLKHHQDSTIILIGAGLDSRAYRFTGGKWIEIDEPALIEYKNSVLPVSECKNPLERIAIDFENEKLADKLSPYADRPDVIIIIEGVFLYLTRDQKEALLKTLTKLFPKHILFCDLLNKKFFEKMAKDMHKKLSAQGAGFQDITNEPEKIFLVNGYHKTSVIQILKTAKDLGLLKIPSFIINFLYKKTMMGYSVYTFSYRA